MVNGAIPTAADLPWSPPSNNDLRHLAYMPFYFSVEYSQGNGWEIGKLQIHTSQNGGSSNGPGPGHIVFHGRNEGGFGSARRWRRALQLVGDLVDDIINLSTPTAADSPPSSNNVHSMHTYGMITL
ncbi:hypothetical protein DCAR_0207693 [Daucus carota subsp. sativus]|uniref:Uncharacterized protein n=1 Tax=Daucus carota subsp. sativus TaxID=79200 RepID=A0A162AU81_DAUCS|nr:hypothetical protein DCAR_0207693 [Daucus carota subsp. sativus]